MDFFSGFFLGSVKHSSMLIRYPCRMGGQVDGLGLQKLITDLERFYRYKGEHRVMINL